MKQKLIASLIAIIVCFNVNAQSKTINDLVNYDIKNYGVMLNNTNTVDGYYNFYEGEKLKKKQRQYIIEILDENLNTIVKTNYVDSKYVNLIGAKYNQEQLMLCLFDAKEKQYKFVGFDKKGIQKAPYIIQLESKDLKTLEIMNKMNQYVEFHAIQNKGFLFKYFKKGKKTGYVLEFIPTDGSPKWTVGTPEKAKAMEVISFAGISEKGISYYLFKRKSLLSKEMDLSTIILNIKGEKIFENVVEEAKEPFLLSNTFFKDNTFINVGEYFSLGENVIKDESNGIVFSEYDYNGNLIKEQKTDWSNNIFGKFKKSTDEKNRNHLFIHEVVKTNSGDFYAIAESYRRSASAKGILSNALSIAAMATGNGGGKIGGVTKLTITDAYFIKLDSGYQLQEMKSFEKGKTYADCMSDFGSTTINAQIVNQFGGFDFMYTQNNPEKDRFYSLFNYKKIIKGASDKPVVKSITYNAGTFSVDEIQLKNGKNTSYVFPAKAQHVLLADYNKKKKTLTMHLEKFNIE